MSGRKDAKREPKTGTKHEPDVVIPGKHMRALVMWENWWRRPGNQRRTATRMAVMEEATFFELLKLDTEGRFGYHVQCKSTQKLSVRQILDGLLAWMKGQT